MYLFYILLLRKWNVSVQWFLHCVLLDVQCFWCCLALLIIFVKLLIVPEVLINFKSCWNVWKEFKLQTLQVAKIIWICCYEYSKTLQSVLKIRSHLCIELLSLFQVKDLHHLLSIILFQFKLTAFYTEQVKTYP